MRFELVGVDEMVKSINAKTKEAIELALLDTTTYLLSVIDPRVPIDTGQLINSAEIEKLHWNTFYLYYEAYDPVTGYPYAPIQEKYKGYVSGGVNNNRNNALVVFKDALGRYL